MRWGTFACGFVVALVGCRPTVETHSSTSTGTTGDGSGGVGGTHGAAGGRGGGTAQGVFVGASSGTGGSFACNEPNAAYSLELDGDGSAQQLDSGCTEAMPWAHYTEAPAGGGGLEIHACLAGSSVTMFLGAGIMSVGTDAAAGADYTDAEGATWQTSQPAVLSITHYWAAGESIDGSFTAIVERQPPGSDAGTASLSLSGSFHVCHRPDLLAP